MITLPIYYTDVKKTKSNTTFLVGMNWARNAYPHLLNKVKIYYTELITTQVTGATPIKGKFKMQYKLYYKNSVCDPSNIIAMIEKFALDALQKSRIIQQDSVKYHIATEWVVVDQDKENPRVELEIIPIK